MMKNEHPIHSHAEALQEILNISWRKVWIQEEQELTSLFEQHGDRAYGVWIHRFMAPVCERIVQEGYDVKSGFNLKNSIERWGPPEERERCAWYVVNDKEGLPLCTLVLQVYHSHAAFHVPRPPRLFTLEATDRQDIIQALSQASVRVRWDLPQQRLPDAPSNRVGNANSWEYATDVTVRDCLAPGRDASLSNWYLDESFSHWGRHGWELVNVINIDCGIVAFFKRPSSA